MGKTVAPITRIETAAEARAFAAHLRDSKRTDVIAVMSTGVKETDTRLDAGAAAFKLAEIGVRSYVIVTGPATQELKDQIGKEQSLYGGAVRVYPTGTAWIANPYVSPLRLGMPGVNPIELTNFLVEEAKKIVSGDAPAQHEYRSPANGSGNSVGAALSAAMEHAAKRSGELPEQPKKAAQPKRVVKASARGAAAAARVASPPSPSSAPTPAVVTPAKVAPAPSPSVATPVPVLPVPTVVASVQFEEPMSVDLARQGIDALISDLARVTRERDDLAARLQDEIAAVVERDNAHLRRVVERLTADHGEELAAADARHAESLRSLASRHAATLADAEARVSAAEADAAERRRTIDSITAELSSAHDLGRTLAKSLRDAEQRATNAEATADDSALTVPVDLFDDATAAVQYAIRIAWAQRIPAADKADWPLPEYRIGDRFASSLLALHSGHRAKALRATVDILTGMGNSVSARRIHPLRSSEAATAAPVTDPETGAVCMRASIESNTASARRLHFWKHPDGTIELIRVVLHEDMTP